MATLKPIEYEQTNKANATMQAQELLRYGRVHIFCFNKNAILTLPTSSRTSATFSTLRYHNTVYFKSQQQQLLATRVHGSIFSSFLKNWLFSSSRLGTTPVVQTILVAVLTATGWGLLLITTGRVVVDTPRGGRQYYQQRLQQYYFNSSTNQNTGTGTVDQLLSVFCFIIIPRNNSEEQLTLLIDCEHDGCDHHHYSTVVADLVTSL